MRSDRSGIGKKLSAVQSVRSSVQNASNDVVDGVRGDKSVGGSNGSLYEEMGYVPKDERNSGLTRKGKKPPTDPKA